MNQETAMVMFKDKNIRRVWHNDEWFFSVVDICAALTESADANAYWRKLKQRLVAESDQVVTFCHGLKLPAPDGKLRETDCANTEGIFRIVQSIPSPNAEPFKRWLAKVGYERLEEIENPELAAKRTREIYKQKGYSDEWIEKRVRGIAVRDELTDEWKKRGVKEEKESQGFFENKDAAQEGGVIAGGARQALEKTTGKKISTKRNYKLLPENK